MVNGIYYRAKPKDAVGGGDLLLYPSDVGSLPIIERVNSDKTDLFCLGNTHYVLSKEEVDDTQLGEMIAIINMSNSQKYFGASAVLDTKKLDEICEIMGDDLIILPSSIHEVLIISAEGHDPKELCQIVHDVNSSCVSPEEVLSENVYLYDRELHQVKTCEPELGLDERDGHGI